ncbi:unnamed protein product [Lactuca virosa]|uniref:BRCT domain-containing protein n=1 Tax=Lactuca virosa TaxID=75947 RepID=A0AAU9N382_9ASTR|nr:unnamed protein product [Lactuca virosa]
MLMNIADHAKKSNLTKIIEDLGGSVTSDGRSLGDITCLAKRKLQRRQIYKMDYIVKDVEYELKYRTYLRNTIVKARANPGGLLKGFEVCLATHVQPPVSTMSAIVRSAGGNVIRSVEKAKDSRKTMSAVKKGIATFSNEWFMNCVMK